MILSQTVAGRQSNARTAVYAEKSPVIPGKRFQPRICESVLALYFAYTSVLALLLPIAPAVRLRALAANALTIALAAWAAARPATPRLLLLRNLLPIAAVLLAYQQMGWFALPHDSFELERSWVRWDKLLLNDAGLRAAIEMAGPLLPGLLELLYLSTYILGPFGIAAVALTGNAERMDRFLSMYALSAVFAYALFPYFPSEPPRTVFPGEDFPSFDTAFRRLNWWLLAGGGIHTSVFPSGHVSSAFGAAFGLLYALPRRPTLGLIMLAAAGGIAVATVYGRYHYAVDALAGLAASLAAACVCLLLFRRRGKRGNARRNAAAGKQPKP